MRSHTLLPDLLRRRNEAKVLASSYKTVVDCSAKCEERETLNRDLYEPRWVPGRRALSLRMEQLVQGPMCKKLIVVVGVCVCVCVA